MRKFIFIFLIFNSFSVQASIDKSMLDKIGLEPGYRGIPSVVCAMTAEGYANTKNPGSDAPIEKRPLTAFAIYAEVLNLVVCATHEQDLRYLENTKTIGGRIIEKYTAYDAYQGNTTGKESPIDPGWTCFDHPPRRIDQALGREYASIGIAKNFNMNLISKDQIWRLEFEEYDDFWKKQYTFLQDRELPKYNCVVDQESISHFEKTMKDFDERTSRD